MARLVQTTNLAFDKHRLLGLDDEQVLTVSEASMAVKRTVEENFSSSIKIRGEISGVKKHTSGHTYLTLKDDAAVLNAVCWRGTHVSFPLEDGVEIIARGKITVYPARSQYQFVIEDASIAGEGALLKLLNERKKIYAGLGYFDKKRPLPKFSQIIGIITSPTGAVLQDMRNRLEDRYAFCKVVVWPVSVQGAGAAEQIAEAIRGLNALETGRPDLLIVARGGGSIEDLWAFNEEEVVKAVFESDIVVVSAIRHETDTTLIDYAADCRAPTPTAAIELATPNLTDVKMQIANHAVKLLVLIQRTAKECTIRFQGIAERLPMATRSIVCAKAQDFDWKTEALRKAISERVQQSQMRLRLVSARSVNLAGYLALKVQRLDVAKAMLERLMREHVSRLFEKIETLGNRLEQSSIKKTLERGFCFVTDEQGNVVGTKAELQRSDCALVAHFADGVADIRVA